LLCSRCAGTQPGARIGVTDVVGRVRFLLAATREPLAENLDVADVAANAGTVVPIDPRS
jgi:hypothetical protein